MLICHRTHNASHCQTVKVIINKNQHAQQNRSKLRPYPALNMYAGPPSECCGTSRLVHQAHHDSKHYQEYQNTDVVTVRQHAYDTVLEYMGNGSLKCEAGVKDSSNQDSYE